MSFGSVPADSAEPPRGIDYPAARKEGVVEDYHGTKVPDPYRWLEDPDSPETRAWVEAENKVTFAYLGSIPVRDEIKERLTKLWDYEKFGAPRKEGSRYFYSRNTGLQNQSVLFSADRLEADPRVLIDPNTLSADGTVALGGTAISDDGSLIAYGLSAAGSDWSGVQGSRRRHRRGPTRPPQVDQVLRCVLDQGRQGVLLRPLPRARSRATTSRLPTTIRSSTSTRSARPRIRITLIYETPRREGMAVPRQRHR